MEMFFLEIYRTVFVKDKLYREKQNILRMFSKWIASKLPVFFGKAIATGLT